MATSATTLIPRGRMLQQVLPQAPPTYDQIFVNQLVNAINNFMGQSAAPGDVLGARFIMQDFPVVDPTQPQWAYPDTSRFPTGMLYLLPFPGNPGAYYLTVLLPPGTFVGTGYIRLNPDPPIAHSATESLQAGSWGLSGGQLK